MSWARSAIVAAFLVFGAAACAGNQNGQAQQGADKAKEAQQDGPSTVIDARKRKENLKREGRQVETFDLNQDQRADQWEVRNEAGKLVRVERDMNFDGQVDVWQYPDSDGNVVEEEMDLDMDGTIDLVTHYKDGKVRRKELSTEFDEQFSIVKFYNKEGKLLRVERDEDGDGSVEVWEYYDDSGNRERIGWDDNGDGVPDSFDDLP
jgi:antitoxin component YwqK of YwqJK toxin-antitoxin module